MEATKPIESEVFTITTLFSVCILFLYTISHSIFDKYKFHYVHESGLSMLIGILVTLVAMLISPNVNRI
jgi:hypothetical protein